MNRAGSISIGTAVMFAGFVTALAAQQPSPKAAAPQPAPKATTTAPSYFNNVFSKEQTSHNESDLFLLF
jgi:hypothetical protein